MQDPKNRAGETETKRKREVTSSQTSPQSEAKRMTGEKGVLGKADLNALKDMILSTVGTLIEQKISGLASKKETDLLKGRITSLEQENLCLKEKLDNLTVECKNQFRRIEIENNRSRRNNLIFSGIAANENEDLKALIKHFCQDFLKIEENLYINRAKFIGKTGQRLIIVHFPNDGDIELILQRTKHLKGTSIFIQRDFSPLFRYRRGKLFGLRKLLLKIDGKINVKIVQDFLLLNGTKFILTDENKLQANGRNGYDVIQELLGNDARRLVEKEWNLIQHGDGQERIGKLKGGSPSGKAETSKHKET